MSDNLAYNYKFHSVAGVIRNKEVIEQISKILQDYQAVAKRSFDMKIEGSFEQILDRLGQQGMAYDISYSSSQKTGCFVLLDGFAYYIKIFAKNNLNKMTAQIMLNQEQIQSKTINSVKKEAKNKITNILGDLVIDQPTMNVEWYHYNGDYTESDVMIEVLDDVVYPESYPGLDMNNYIQRYFDSQEAVVLMMGEPGTGKTRLIRHIMSQMKQRKGKVKVKYTNQEIVIRQGNIFKSFVQEGTDLLILEDIDDALAEREQGNKSIATILNATDGIIRSGKKGKMIMTTNLPNVDHIDKALIRPGRCFDVLRLRKLSAREGMKVLKRLDSFHQLDDSKEYTLAEIYEIANEGESRHRLWEKKEVGFEED